MALRLHIVGNCQAAPIALLLERMNAGLSCSFQANARSSGDPSKADFVVHQGALSDGLRGQLRGLSDQRFIRIPRIIFAGFHPDNIAVIDQEGRVVPSIGWHSRLVFYAWKAGAPAPEIEALFDDATFENLEYGAVFSRAIESLLAEGAASGFRLEEHLPKWCSRGCFMSGINHPKLFVLADIARDLLKILAIPPQEERPEEHMPDLLARAAVWPVYPYIARQRGLSEGSYIFRAIGQNGQARVFQLGEAVRAFVDIYNRYSLQSLSAAPENAAIAGKIKALLALRR